MSLPSLTTVAETYLAGRLVTITLGGTLLGTVEDGSYTIEGMNDDMTNQSGQGWVDDVATVKKASGTFKIAYEAGVTPDIHANATYAMIIDGGGAITDPIYLAGNVRIDKVDVAALNAKGGVSQSFSWHSRGAMVTAKPS